MTYAIFEISINGSVLLAETEELFGKRDLTFLHLREAISHLESEIRKENPKLKAKGLPFYLTLMTEDISLFYPKSNVSADIALVSRYIQESVNKYYNIGLTCSL